ncbi:MAG: hypothetical protein ACFB0G_04490 [Leptolyngbyaceae cyanobacterium]
MPNDILAAPKSIRFASDVPALNFTVLELRALNVAAVPAAEKSSQTEPAIAVVKLAFINLSLKLDVGRFR